MGGGLKHFRLQGLLNSLTVGPNVAERASSRPSSPASGGRSRGLVTMATLVDFALLSTQKKSKKRAFSWISDVQRLYVSIVSRIPTSEQFVVFVPKLLSFSRSRSDTFSSCGISSTLSRVRARGGMGFLDFLAGSSWTRIVCRGPRGRGNLAGARAGVW